MSGEVLPRRRSCVETLRAPSLPLVAPPLGFPRYRAPEGALKGELGSLEAWMLGSLVLLVGLCPTLRLPFFIKRRQGAKRRAAVAVSGEAAERPMEPEAVRAHPCVFAVPISLGTIAFIFVRWPHPSPRRGVPFSVAVEGLALRACTLRSPFSGARQPLPVSSPPEAAARAPTSGAPPSLQTSKLPSFQATKKRTARRREPRGHNNTKGV